MRWVDDIWMTAICLNKAGTRFDARVRLRKTWEHFAKESLDEVSQVYLQTDFSLKGECPETFAGFQLDWCKEEMCFNSTAITTSFPKTDGKYHDAWSCIPRAMNNALVYGIIICNIDKTCRISDLSRACWLRQWKALVASGYYKHLVKAVRNIFGQHKIIGNFLSDMAANFNFCLSIWIMIYLMYVCVG